MRLIDADALMKKIREVDFVADVDLMKITHDSMLTGFFHGSVQGIVDRLPTAQDDMNGMNVVVEDVKFCPMCGAKLKELEG